MAVVVTFGRVSTRRAVFLPLMKASAARSEEIALGSTAPTAGTFTATADENVAWLFSADACWVAIGPAPDPESDDCHFLPAGIQRDFELSAGDTVAVIAV